MHAKVRPARTEDKESLMAFIREVWGGHDYIPYVWDEWLSDTKGKMFVVEYEGVPVGMNRVRFLEDGSAWFEGVRVHPDFRGRGLATLLGENSMAVAGRRGVKVFRLTSNSRNKPAHRQVSRMNFREECRISVYDRRKGSRHLPQSGVNVPGPRDIDSVEAAIRATSEYKLGRGLMWDTFTAFSLTRAVILNRLKEGSVSILGGAVAITRPGREGKNIWNQVCFLGGSPDEAAKLVSHSFALGSKADWSLAYVPQGSPVIAKLRSHGLKRSFSLILFERGAAKG